MIFFQLLSLFNFINQNFICHIYYTKILEVNLFAFAYRLFHDDFSPESPVDWREIFMKHSVGKCKQINF